MQSRLIVKTLFGLEQILASELKGIGAKNIQILNRAVECSGDLETIYRANYTLRTALRILRPLFGFKAGNPEELYKNIAQYPWEDWFSYKKSISIDSVVHSDTFRHSRYVSQKVKDGIVDRFRAKYHLRPSVDLNDPDVRIHIHINADHCDVSLDSSGDSLHKRGYRTTTGQAPLNEVLAAGMIHISGWNPTVPLIDPMCGSGTLLIEACMMGMGVPAGYFRQKYCFQDWNDYDPELFSDITKNASGQKIVPVNINGADISQQAIAIAKRNIQNAGFANHIRISKSSFLHLHQNVKPGIIITNPPYGERMNDKDLLELYKSIGDKLKKDFTGWTVWILSGNQKALKHIGLHASKKYTLYNGAIMCKFQQYDLYKGSRKGQFQNEKK